MATMTPTTLGISEHTRWLFDDSPIPDPHGKGQRAIDFIRALKHPKSTRPGRAFQLDKWQERIIRRVIGDTDEHGQRKIKKVFLMVGRGNRKTTLAGALAALFTFGPERTPSGRTYSIANSRDQAALTYDELAGIVRAHPRVNEACVLQDTLKTLRHPKSSAKFAALSSDAKTAHGLTPNFCFADELHEFTKADLYEAMQTGLNKSRGGLMFIGTTAGIGTETAAYSVYEYARKVALGHVEDPHFLPIIFQMEKGDDWRDEAVWIRTNPGLSCKPAYPDIDALRVYAKECEHRPAQRESMRRLHLGEWLDGAAEPAWDLSVWDENGGPVDLDQLAGRRAWLSVDLSSRVDLTAVGAAIELEDGRFALHVQSFAPAAELRKRAAGDGVPYALWRDQGWLTECPGDIIDTSMVEAHIRRLCGILEVREIAFDPWRAQDMMRNLGDEGLPVAEFPQNITTYAGPVNDFEEAMFARRLAHGGNPVLRWAIGNVVLHADANNNRRPMKQRAKDRIDPAVAAIIAVGRAVANSSIRSIFDDPDFDPNSLIF